MKPAIEALTPWTWNEYVTNLAVDATIQKWMVGIGVFYLLCAVACLFYEKMPRWVRWPIWLGVVGQVLLALLYMKEFFFSTGQFLEYALQFSTPVFLIYFAKYAGGTQDRSNDFTIPAWLVLAMKIATALTFACHGLYAVGYYPRPGLFTTMVMHSLHCSEVFAVNLLLVAGWLDFAVAVGIFLPFKWSKWFLLYAAIWGLLTSFARITGNFFWDFPLESLHEWAHQMVYRLPHGLVPLVVFMIGQSIAKQKANAL